MSDRVPCLLGLFEPLPDPLYDLAVSLLGKPDEAIDCSLAWYSVDYGGLPETLREALSAAGIRFSWAWGNGDEFPAGVYISDPEMGTSEWMVPSGRRDIVLPVRDITPEKLAEAQRWQAWIDTHMEAGD